jgi:hypothetical protein
MCEIRLGRKADPDEKMAALPPVPLEKLVGYLRELARSVERHTLISGRQGYLTFIDKYVP